MEELLLKLLENGEPISLKGIGSFSLIHNSADINRKKALLPPTVELLFAHQSDASTSFNVMQAAAENNISAEEVEQFVANINKQIEQNGTYELHNMGVLSMSAEGNLTFTPDTNGVLYASNIGLQPIPLRKKRTGWIVCLLLLFLLIGCAVGLYFYKPDVYTPVRNQIATWVQKIKAPKKEEPAPTPAPEPKQPQPEEPAEDTTLVTSTDEEVVPAEEPAVVEPEEPQAELSANIYAPENKVRYYIIGSSTNSQEEAEKIVRSFRKQGYRAYIVANIGEAPYRISYNDYATKEEANNQREALIAEGMSKSIWVLRFK